MYRGEASSRLLLSVPPRCRLVFGCLRDGVAWRGGGADPRVLHWLPARGEPPADPLTPFTRNSSPAARASSVRYRRPSEEGSPLHPTGVAHPGGVWCPNSPWDTSGSTCAPAAAATPAPTHSQPCRHAVARLSPAPAHACHQPRHTRVTAPLAPGTGGQGPGVCGTPALSPWPGVGMEGDRGRRATLPAHAPRGASSPALARPSPETLPPGQGWGVTRTRCPCAPPRPRKLVRGSRGRMGVSGTPSASTPHPAPSPAAGEAAGGPGAAPREMDGWN